MEELPFVFAESEEYRKHISFFNPEGGKMLVGATTIKDGIIDMYSYYQDRLCEIFSKVNHFNLTFDGWTSNNHYPMLGVTVHWIDSDWISRSVILDLIEIQGDHDGPNLTNHLLSILNKFKITEKIYCITADNAPVNGAIARNLETTIPNFTRRSNLFGCIAHVINLAVKEALKIFTGKFNPNRIELPEAIDIDTLSDIVKDTSGLVGKVVEGGHLYKTRPEFAADIRASTKILLNKELGLKTECDTRWNSIQQCIARYLEVKKVLKLKFESDPNLEYIRLSDAEWDVLECLNDFLKPFARLSSKLSAAHLTFPSATPAYEAMIEALERVSPLDSCKPFFFCLHYFCFLNLRPKANWKLIRR